MATMASLFRDHKVEPVPLAGEPLVEARQRVLKVVKHSNVELLLQMSNADAVTVRWSRR